MTLESWVFLGGLGQLAILVASSLVPFRLNWKKELGSLSRLHRQMYWVYGGYVVLSILAFAIISLKHAEEIAAGGGLARAFSLYVAIFWGIRLVLQGVFDAAEHLTTWWLRAGYRLLSLLFLSFTLIYGWVAFGG